MSLAPRIVRRLVLLAPFLAAASGCYHYVPAGASTPPQGTPVRLHMERPESFELPAITVHNIGELEAEMVREDLGELVVSALWLRAVTGQGYPGGGWTLRIDQGKISRVEVRSLSRWRTAAVFIGAVAATWLGFDALQGSNSGDGGGGGGGQPR